MSQRIFLAFLLSSLTYGQAWNATGIFPVSVNLAQAAQPKTEWTVETAVSQYNTTSPNLVTDHITQRVWANVPNDPACSGDNQFNAVCGISWFAANSNATHLFGRMQNDPGDCSTGISLNCRNDLASTARDYLTKNAEATTFQFPDICGAIAFYLSKHIPESCSGNDDVKNLLATPLGGELLSASRDERCQNGTTPRRRDVEGSWDPYTITQASTFDNRTVDNFQEIYDFYVTSVTPFLITSFPVNETSYLDKSSNMTVDNQMLCIRPQNITTGSEKPSEIPDIFDEKSTGDRLKTASTMVLVTMIASSILMF